MDHLIRRPSGLLVPPEPRTHVTQCCNLFGGAMMAGGADSYISAQGWRVRLTQEGNSMLWWRVDELMMFTSLDGTGSNLVVPVSNTITSGYQFSEIPDNAFQGTPASTIDDTSATWAAAADGQGLWIGHNFGSPIAIGSIKL